jgi:signal transduction histidine kinase
LHLQHCIILKWNDYNQHITMILDTTLHDIPPPHTSLSRDFLVLTLIIFVAYIFVSIWVAQETYESYSADVVSDLKDKAQRIDKDIATEIENISFVLESLGRQINYTGAEHEYATAALLKSFNHESHRKDIFAWVDDKQRITITSYKGMLRQNIDISDRDYIKKTLTTPWKMHIGRPVFGRLSDKWVLPLSMGITDYSDHYVGAVLASIDIEDLMQKTQSVLKGDSISMSILSRTYMPLLESPSFLQQRSHLNLITKIPHINEANTATASSYTLSRTTMYHRNANNAIYWASARYPYIIILSDDNKLNGVIVRSTLIPRLLQVLVITLFLVMLLLLVQMRVIHPVSILSYNAEDILHGRPYQQIPSSSPKEVLQLADKIQTISDYIQERVRIESELTSKNNYLKRIKDSAQLLNTARMHFLDSLAQELQKPVALINEFSQSMKEQHFGTMQNEQYLKQASEIYQSSEELKQMVKDITTIAKLEEDNLSLNERMMDLTFCIHRALRTFHEQPQNRHTEVKLRMDNDLPRFQMDEERFHQILINVLNSAASHMVSSSTIVFEVDLDKRDDLEQMLVLVVKYNLAMESETQHTLRERQLHAQSAPHTQKNLHAVVQSEGINMALTRMLVSLHQGEIETRVSPNKVVRQYIRFPIQRVKFLQDMHDEFEPLGHA